MQRLENVARRYAWGSATAIPNFLGIPSDGEPFAELWLSAHPGGSSKVADGVDTSLYELILADPNAYLGAQIESRFGARLPFLMKLIAPSRPLSIQVHPNLHQAQAGFERDATPYVAAEGRTYVDPFHKPEMLYALGDFEILVGFRRAADSARILRRIGIEQTTTWADVLDQAVGDVAAEGRAIREIFAQIAASAKRSDALVVGFSEVASVAGNGNLDPISREAFQTALEVAEDYPGDQGIILSLLLNRMRLSPGEAIFVGAGTVHCYLRGLGVEIMASSDNVLRAGLTPKHVNVSELLKITDFRPARATRVVPDSDQGTSVFAPGAEEFQLRIVELSYGTPVELMASGPRLVLALSGEVVVKVGDDQAVLRQGDSAIIGHGEGLVRMRGSAVLALGETPSLHC